MKQSRRVKGAWILAAVVGIAGSLYLWQNYANVTQRDGKTHIDFGRKIGRLEVSSNVPNAELVVNDLPMGELAQGRALIELAPGNYVVGVKYAGYGIRRRNVAVEFNQTASVSISLSPNNGFEVVDSATARPDDGKALVAVETDFGGAVLYLDGKEVVGVKTPLIVNNLASGNWAIEARLEDRRIKRSVSIYPGRNDVKLFFDKVAEENYLEAQRLIELARIEAERKEAERRAAEVKAAEEARQALAREQERMRIALLEEQRQIERQRQAEELLNLAIKRNTARTESKAGTLREWMDASVVSGLDERGDVRKLRISRKDDYESNTEGNEKDGRIVRRTTNTYFQVSLDDKEVSTLHFPGYSHYGVFRGERISFIFNAYKHDVVNYEQTGTAAGVLSGSIDAYPFSVEIRNWEKDTNNYTILVAPHPRLLEKIKEGMK
jgi:hypothetical protein